MKKVLALMLAVFIALSFTACKKETPVENPSSNNVEPSVASDGRTSGGYTEAGLNEKVKTNFFNFTVESVEKIEEYQGLTPSEGKVFLLVKITSENIWGGQTPMYYDDYQIQWGGEGADDYGYSYLDQEGTMGLVARETILEENESMTALYLYEVPADSTRCSVSYLEIYEDDFQGNVFFVYFDV